MSFKAALLATLLLFSYCGFGQADSSVQAIHQIPTKYLNQIEDKAGKYSKRLTTKTEKTLTKLSRWENKIKSLLEKASPASAQRLFTSGSPTFTSTLSQYKAGQTMVSTYKASYDAYRDKLTTGLKFIEAHKPQLDSNGLRKVAALNKEIDSLEKEVAKTEALQKFINERKKMLISESVKHIGKSKYLQKINKESFYYVETLKNYKEIFNDKKKAEETALTILNKIPAFEKFVKSNSVLSSLFRTPDNYGTAQSLAGLQTRASVNALIQDGIAAGGPNARETISQNFQAAQNELSKLKDKLIKAGGVNNQDELPDFKPNMQKTKTFMQRLEFGSNFQFGRVQSFMPANANIGLQAGYKLNDKSIVGIGASYKLGMGKIDKIQFTHEGIGLRSFIDWKIKKQFFVSGGYEMNYNTSFKNLQSLRDIKVWQASGLIGLSKKIVMKSKFMKGSQVQLLYDILHSQHAPGSQPLIFRIGYSFN